MQYVKGTLFIKITWIDIYVYIWSVTVNPLRLSIVRTNTTLLFGSFGCCEGVGLVVMLLLVQFSIDLDLMFLKKKETQTVAWGRILVSLHGKKMKMIITYVYIYIFIYICIQIDKNIHKKKRFCFLYLYSILEKLSYNNYVSKVYIQIIQNNVWSNLSTRVSLGELQKWPLLTGGLCSERQKLPIRFSRDKLGMAFVDRKPLLAGVLVHRFDFTDKIL